MRLSESPFSGWSRSIKATAVGIGFLAIQFLSTSRRFMVVGPLGALVVGLVAVAGAVVMGGRLPTRVALRTAFPLGLAVGLVISVMPQVGHAMSQSGSSLGTVLLGLIASLWTDAVPLGVGCWLAAGYGASGTDRDFWLGAGGAAIRGGFFAALSVLPVAFGLQMCLLGSESEYLDLPLDIPWRIFPLAFLAVLLREVVWGVGAVAVLILWRLQGWVAALVGGVLLLVLVGASWGADVLRHGRLFVEDPAFRSVVLWYGAYTVIPPTLLGGIAGLFAARWRQPEDTDCLPVGHLRQ